MSRFYNFKQTQIFINIPLDHVFGMSMQSPFLNRWPGVGHRLDQALTQPASGIDGTVFHLVQTWLMSPKPWAYTFILCICVTVSTPESTAWFFMDHLNETCTVLSLQGGCVGQENQLKTNTEAVLASGAAEVRHSEEDSVLVTNYVVLWFYFEHKKDKNIWVAGRSESQIKGHVLLMAQSHWPGTHRIKFGNGYFHYTCFSLGLICTQKRLPSHACYKNTILFEMTVCM